MERNRQNVGPASEEEEGRDSQRVSIQKEKVRAGQL